MIVLTRREVLFGLTGMGILAGCRDRDAVSKHPGVDTPQTYSQVLVFTPEQQPTIDAVVDTILPGAKAAGVSSFIAYWMARKPFEATRRFLLRGLKIVDRQAIRRHKQRFDACPTAEREGILEAVSENKVGEDGFNAALFYQQLVELTLEGYLSHPKYGGNRDRAGWRFIGIPDGLRSCWWNPNGVEGVLHDD